MLRQRNSYKCTISVVKAPSYPPTSNLLFYMRTKRVLTPPKSPSTLEVLQLPYTVKLWAIWRRSKRRQGPCFHQYHSERSCSSSRGPEYWRHVLGVWRCDNLPSKGVR